MSNEQVFYVVWNPARNAPVARHPTRHAARAEAERLARKQPGDRFYVLGALSLSQVPSITSALIDDDEGLVW